MYKVIISDDEAKVCTLIKSLIDWKNLGIELVGIGYNGLESLELIRKNNPEIVITDIRMPGIDGLELVRKVREEGFLANFIVISGYRQFEFARKAIKYGVEDYLLKPINKEELINAIKKIIRQYESDIHSAENEHVEINSKLLRQHFIANFAFDRSKDNEYTIDKVNEICQLEFKEGYYQVVIIKNDGFRNMSEDEIESVESALVDSLEEFYKEWTCELVCFKKENAVYCILNFSKESSADDFLEKLMVEIKKITAKFKLKGTIGLGGRKDRFSDIQSSAEEAEKAVKCRIDIGVGGVIDYLKLSYETETLKDIVGKDWRRQFATALETLDPQYAEEQLTCIFGHLDDWDNAAPWLYYELCSECIAITVGVLPVNEQDINDGMSMKFIKLKIRNSETSNDMYKHLCSWMKMRIDTSLKNRNSQERLPIRKVKKYLKSNYMNKISLEDVAEEVHFNSSYLSVMFKNEVGINFNEYLAQIRIDAAKDMLRKGVMNMDYIAESVGYQNTRYFSRLFKRMVGVTPSRYRQLFS